jgi:hypothetical protein
VPGQLNSRKMIDRYPQFTVTAEETALQVSFPVGISREDWMNKRTLYGSAGPSG